MQENPQPWQDRWSAGRTMWDMGGPHPLLATGLAVAQQRRVLQAGASVYVPGCGRAHNAAQMAREGYQVRAADLVPQAIAAARELHGNLHGLELVCEDALAVPEAEAGRYAMVFDRAMFCALQPENRSAYLDACRRRLAPGGIFFGLLFTAVNKPDGPPFALPVTEIAEAFHGDFSLVHMAEYNDPSADGVIGAELLCLFRKRTSSEHGL